MNDPLSAKTSRINRITALYLILTKNINNECGLLSDLSFLRLYYPTFLRTTNFKSFPNVLPNPWFLVFNPDFHGDTEGSLNLPPKRCGCLRAHLRHRNCCR